MRPLQKRTGTEDQADLLRLFKDCQLCPRYCGINRMVGQRTALSGFCKQDYLLRIAYVGAHFGEEPPITGSKGSGTIFFSGCSLQCSFCQNHQISRDGLGKTLIMEELFKKVLEMIQVKNVHNINFVTPDHFFPYTFQLVRLLRMSGYDLPIIYNLSGYQSIAMLGMAEDYAEIYLPDFKYSDPSVSTKLSRCKDYTKVALEAIVEMVRQKGFLDSFINGAELAKKGVLVRHLILPGKIENSLNALNILFLEFGAGLPLSLMSQYHPTLPHEDLDLNRSLTREEFDRVYSYALDLGFENLFVQFLDRSPDISKYFSHFIPDFRMEEPFSGNSPNY
ncbi:radical SAM protein [Thermodesulfobacteriota bacterium]